MAANLDMSLDDIIRSNKASRGGQQPNLKGRRRGGSSSSTYTSSGPGPSRRFTHRAPLRTAPYTPHLQPVIGQALGWQHQVLTGGGAGGESGTKLYISNLDYGVSNEDIKILFSEVGELKRYSIHYDRSGRSKGTAEVVFLHQSDAVAAIKRYNNVQLDGKPMKLELVGVNLIAPAAAVPATRGILGNPRAPFRSVRERVGDGSGRGRGGHGFGRGRGQGGGAGRDKKVSALDLDADLEKYHLESMQIN